MASPSGTFFSPNYGFPFGGPQLIDAGLLSSIISEALFSSQDGVTASTTQTRAGGTPIVATFSRISSANASDAVTLEGAGAVVQAGDWWVIANKSGQTVQVFPPGVNDKIDGGTAGAAVNLSTAKLGVYIVTANVGGVLTISSGSMAVSS